MINIEGLNKADVLRVLYDNSRPLGLGFLYYIPAPMMVEEAEELLKVTTNFDYLKGRIMKIDLNSDVEFEEWLYDRDNGNGSAQRAIKILRKE